MSAAENEAIARRWYDALNRGDVDALDQMVDENIVDHSGLTQAHGQGRAGHKNMVRGFRQAFPDWQETIDDISVQGDKVVIRHTGRGTHKGAFMGQAPDNKQKVVQAVDTIRIANGKIVEHWSEQGNPFGSTGRP